MKAYSHKPHFCIFCKNEVQRINQHFLRRHSKEEKVQNIVSIKDPKERRWAWKCLRQQGDFYYNEKLPETGTNKKTVRVASFPLARKKYFNCPNCLGRLRTCSRVQHLKVCEAIGKKEHQEPPEEHLEDLLNGMGEALVNKIRKSPQLQKFLEFIFSEKGKEYKNTLRTMAGDLVALEEELQKVTANDKLLINYFSGNHVDHVISSIKSLSGEYRNGKNQLFRYPTKAQRFCRTVEKLGKFLHTTYVKRDMDAEATEVNKFLSLFETDSEMLIKKQALRTIKLEHFKNPPVRPKTRDVRKFIEYVQTETPKLLAILKERPNEKTWRNLAQNILCRLTIFNRSKGGAVEKMKIADFTARKNKNKNLTEESVFDLSLEDDQLKNVTTVEVIHKCDNLVQIFITRDVEEAMEDLLRFRERGNINEKNEYFFAATKNSLNPLGGYAAMNKFRQIFPEDIKKLLTTTNLRKHGATTAQVPDLTRQDTEERASHMDHSSLRYYRKREKVSAKLKTGRILKDLHEGVLKYLNGKTVNNPFTESADTTVVNEESFSENTSFALPETCAELLSQSGTPEENVAQCISAKKTVPQGSLVRGEEVSVNDWISPRSRSIVHVPSASSPEENIAQCISATKLGSYTTRGENFVRNPLRRQLHEGSSANKWKSSRFQVHRRRSDHYPYADPEESAGRFSGSLGRSLGHLRKRKRRQDLLYSPYEDLEKSRRFYSGSHISSQSFPRREKRLKGSSCSNRCKRTTYLSGESSASDDEDVIETRAPISGFYHYEDFT